MRPAEHGGRPGWLAPTLAALAVVLALVANLGAAKADGYEIITRMVPDMGWHFLNPGTGARFNLWHPDLVTLHVWLWYHNPAGLYNGTNPLVRPFNRG